MRKKQGAKKEIQTTYTNTSFVETMTRAEYHKNRTPCPYCGSAGYKSSLRYHAATANRLHVKCPDCRKTFFIELNPTIPLS